MFSKAYQIASKFTRPVVMSTMTMGGQVRTGVGAYILLNKEGWILTAAHIVQQVNDWQDQVEKVAEYRAVEADSQHLSPAARKAAVRNVPHRKDWIEKSSVWFGQDGTSVKNGLFHVHLPSDLAVLQLDGLTLDEDQIYPTFKRPNDATMTPGSSLMKLGFPFLTIQSSYDEATKRFGFDASALALFPIEGIMTRSIHVVNEPTKELLAVLLETSSAGLFGQSGGPTVDSDGVVWAMQSKTNGYDLGSHGVFNVGIGTHTQSIQAMLDQAKVEVNWVD